MNRSIFRQQFDPLRLVGVQPRKPVFWWYGISQDPNHLEVLLRSPLVSHVFIRDLGIHDKYPDEWTENGKRALDIIRKHGAIPIETCWLWPGYNTSRDQAELLHADYITEVLDTLAERAKTKGIAETALDVEINAESVLLPLKGMNLRPDNFTRLETEVIIGKRNSSNNSSSISVQYVLPAGEPNLQHHINNAVVSLGIERIAEHTYKPDDDHRAKRLDFNIWGYWLDDRYYSPATALQHHGWRDKEGMFLYTEKADADRYAAEIAALTAAELGKQWRVSC